VYLRGPHTWMLGPIAEGQERSPQFSYANDDVLGGELARWKIRLQCPRCQDALGETWEGGLTLSVTLRGASRGVTIIFRLEV
jgi:hypothetical protein